jgi:hypothetical protein
MLERWAGAVRTGLIWFNTGALVNTEITFRFPWNAGKSFSGCTIAGLSKRSHLHGISYNRRKSPNDLIYNDARQIIVIIRILVIIHCSVFYLKCDLSVTEF